MCALVSLSRTEYGTDAYVRFNNDIEGHAVRNAMRLTELTGTAPASKAAPESSASF